MLPRQPKRHNHTAMMRLARAPKLCDEKRSVAPNLSRSDLRFCARKQTATFLFSDLNNLGGYSRNSLVLLRRIRRCDDASREPLLPPRNLPVPGRPRLDPPGLELLRNRVSAHLLALLEVHGLDKHSLVLVHVTLHPLVERPVQVLVDLLRLPVLLEQTPEHAQATHPQHLGRETSLASSAPLSVSSVTALGLGLGRGTRARARVHDRRLLDDVTVLDRLADGLPCDRNGGGRRVSEQWIASRLWPRATKPKAQIPPGETSSGPRAPPRSRAMGTISDI